jgi:micrococcal nuclease
MGERLRAVLSLATLALATACGGDRCGETEAKVARVIDGDTIELESGVRIRYLLVDTPEIPGDCFAEEAKQFNSALVLGKTVRLSYDQECTDRFGRSLAYVTVGGQEVNSLLVERGYACVLFIPPDGASRADELKALELEAKNAHRGLWSACDPLPPACTRGRRPARSARAAVRVQREREPGSAGRRGTAPLQGIDAPDT